MPGGHNMVSSRQGRPPERDSHDTQGTPMTYREWLTTSVTAQAYAAATDRCAAIFELPTLRAAVDTAEAAVAAAKEITDLEAYKAAVAAASDQLNNALRAWNAAKAAAMTTQEHQRRAERRAARMAEMAAEEEARQAEMAATEAAYQRSVYRSTLATDRQVAYIMSLINRYVRDGDTGRIPGGRLTRQQAAELTRTEASRLIDMLQEEY